jgi:stage II sporulation protein AA (anti-sigma F factor antagonist)
MPLTLQVVKGVGCVTAVVEGEIDLDSRGVLADAIERLEREPVDLVIDLAGVTFVDSQGVNLLVHVHSVLEEAGASLVVARPSPAVRSLLELTGVDAYIELTDEPAPMSTVALSMDGHQPQQAAEIGRIP